MDLFIVNGLCLLLLLGVYLYCSGRSGDRATEKITVLRLLASSGGLCIAHLVLRCSDGAGYTGAGIVTQLAAMLFFMLIPTACLYWLQYTMLQVYGPDFPYRKVFRRAGLPVVLLCLAVIANLFLPIFYTVDGHNCLVARGGLWICYALCGCYCLASAGIALHALRKESGGKGSRESLLLLIHSAVIAAGLGLGFVFPDSAAIQACLVLVIVLQQLCRMSTEIFQDPLTGLNNRRAMEKYVSQQLDKSPRYFTAVMLDIRHFKDINDTYGHVAGDRALIRFSGLLKKTCDTFDQPLFLFRYGADEFSVLTPDMDEQDCRVLLSSFESELEVDTEKDEAFPKLGFTSGICKRYCESSEDVYHLIVYADALLCAAKKEKGETL